MTIARPGLGGGTARRDSAICVPAARNRFSASARSASTSGQPRLSPLLPVNLGDHSPDYIRWTDTASFTCILQIVEDHQVRRLPVIDNHRLVGIITEADLARNLDEHRLAEFVEKVYATT